MNLPTSARRPLEGERFQVIVIGGGINGVAIARQCARAGRRTLLIEQHDFASGTTSRSTRIVHGGLRYLENGELGLVRESLRERQRLLQERPHLVHPIEFLLALGPNSRRGALSVRAGLWLYQRMGGKRLQSETVQSEWNKLQRLLDAGRRWSIFSYEDAQCEFPERLVAEWLGEALEAGAVARNHTQVLAIDVRHGRAQGVLLRDKLSGREERVEGTWVVNATGPWVDRLCQRSRIDTKGAMVGGVRGSHIVLPKFAGAPDAAVYSECPDGHMFFVVPWNDQILVGATEVPDHGDPAKTEPSQDEVEYLLRSLARLFPKTRILRDAVRFAFCGIRPLPASAQQNPSKITRRHIFHHHAEDGAANAISVIGGKLTTAAQLARGCVIEMGLRPKEASTVAVVPEDGLDPLLDQLVVQIANTAGTGERSARGIVEWHGRRSSAIARLAREDTKMRAPLCSHTEHIVAEAVDAFTDECAITLADVLLRRVPVALGPCWSQACGREAVARIRAAVGWSEKQAAAELENFEVERAAFLRKPVQAATPLLAAAD